MTVQRTSQKDIDILFFNTPALQHHQISNSDLNLYKGTSVNMFTSFFHQKKKNKRETDDSWDQYHAQVNKQNSFHPGRQSITWVSSKVSHGIQRDLHSEQ